MLGGVVPSNVKVHLFDDEPHCKAKLPIFVQVLGIVKDVKLSHVENTSDFISVQVLGIVTDDNALQKENAPELIVITLGISTDVNAEQD